jgi:mannan endo-1,4-beta-mannosidase
MVNDHRLDNLVWVWNANAPNGKNAGPCYGYNPGAQCVDILASGIFGRRVTDAHKALFNDPRTLSRGDPLPSPQ